MFRRRHEAVVIACLLAALTGFVACSDEDLTVATADVVGDWTGTTSQQRALGFTVNSGGVTEGDFAYQMTGQCNFTTSHLLNASEAIAISGGKFTSGRTQVGLGVFVTVSGEFTSSTTAKGSVLIQHAPCSDTLNITWTAAKN
jgi:hypothetical protein